MDQAPISTESPEEEPLDLAEIKRVAEGVTEKQAEVIRKLSGILAVNEAAVQILREHRSPWLAVAHKSKRQHDPSELWRDAVRSHQAFREAAEVARSGAARSGNWGSYFSLQARLTRVRLAVLQLYIAAGLYRCRIEVNVDGAANTLSVFCS